MWASFLPRASAVAPPAPFDQHKGARVTDIPDSKHHKWTTWQTLQSVVSGIILLIAANIWTSYSKTIETQNDITKQLILIQATQSASISDLVTIKGQMAGFTQISQSLARIEVKLEEDERRINEIEQVRRAVR